MAIRIVIWLVAGLAALLGLFLLTFGAGGGSGLTDAGVRVMWGCLVGAPVLTAAGWAVAHRRGGSETDGPA